MWRLIRLCTLIAIVSTTINTTSFSQGEMRGWELGPWAGTAFYFGDLNTNYRLSKPNLAGGFVGRFNFNQRLSFAISGNYGKIEAYDSDSKNPYERARNLSFQSTLWDGTAQFEFNFLPYIHGSRDNYFTPYLFAGFSVFSYNPVAEYAGSDPSLAGELIELRPLATEGQFKGEEYLNTATAITYGFGFKFDINYEWSVNIQVSARDTYTDYLDDVSTVYPDFGDLLKDRGQLALDMSDRSIDINGVDTSLLGQEGQQRGDNTHNDFVVYAGIGILYYFGDIRCPEYSRRK